MFRWGLSRYADMDVKSTRVFPLLIDSSLSRQSAVLGQHISWLDVHSFERRRRDIVRFHPCLKVFDSLGRPRHRYLYVSRRISLALL